MGLFGKSSISIDDVYIYVNKLKSDPLLSEYFEEWGGFVQSNPHLWIKEKTELNMVMQLNFDSISFTLDKILSSRDRKRLAIVADECNTISVVYACLVGVAYSVLHKEELTSSIQLPQDIAQAFEITYLPSYQLFELIFDKHYKLNSRMAFQRNPHLADTRRGIVERTRKACLEGSKAVAKLNFIII